MGNDIIDGEFITPRSPGKEDQFIVREGNQAFSVVRIKMDDNRWYNVLLHKVIDESDWSIDFPDIQDITEVSPNKIDLSFEERKALIDKILNFRKFRLVFLFV